MKTIFMKNFCVCLFVLFLVLNNVCSAQVRTIITDGKKDNYSPGDKLKLQVLINTPPNTCIDGLRQVKLFQSGIQILHQSEWKEINRNIWQKEIELSIIENKKQQSILTIFRKTDKQDFCYREQFNLQKQ